MRIKNATLITGIWESALVYFLIEISNSYEGEKMAQNVFTRILSFTDGNVRKQTPFETDLVNKELMRLKS